MKIIYLIINNNPLVLFVECTETNCKTSNVNGLCISSFLNKMGCYLGVKEKLHNDECLIHTITGKV